MDITVKFTIFIVALVFVSVVFAGLLFRGSKRRMRELDERQTELLRLYSNIEELADTFTAEAEDAMNALRGLLDEYGELLKTPLPQPPEPTADAPDPAQITLPIFDVVVADAAEPRGSKRERVLELKDGGLNASGIARELGITRNEVDLILSLGK
jgi:hypothetical protein